MYWITTTDGRELEVTEHQFCALIRAVFTEKYPDKMKQIATFQVVNQTNLGI